MDKPIWTPSEERVHSSNIFKFLHHVRNQQGIKLANYDELYEWSINYPEKFWPEVWSYCEIIAHRPWEQVLRYPEKMPGAEWFVGAELNFAENLLRHRTNKPALIFIDEKRNRRVLSYAELYLKVAQLASALSKLGVGNKDRVAGFLPNMPETVIAMLATTSLGAIWSACSPDFGINAVFDRFSQIKPKVLFTTDGYYYKANIYDCLEKVKSLQEKIPVEHTIVIPYVQENPDIKHLKNTYLYENFIDTDATKINFVPKPFNHPLYILYSSGTTGAPKCIVHSAGGVLIQHLKELILHTDLKPDDIIFYVTTCGWMMWNWLISSLAAGATIVLYDGSALFPKADSLFELIENEKITIFGTSAKYLSAIEKANPKRIQNCNLKPLRTILSTGSPLLPMNYDFVYQQIKSDVCLSSISGGTDIVSCFALGNPLLPVYRGELQCRGLGLKVEIFDDSGKSVRQQKGELVCTAPFPAMPIYFWNDPDNRKYHEAYFEKFSNVWAHGDYAELTAHNGIIIYGRSDTVLKPGGVRIGTAEIYRQVETIEEVVESVVVGQSWKEDVRLILFVKLREHILLSEELKNKIKKLIRQNTSPHHIPNKIIQVPDIPRTINGKIVELAIRDILEGKPVKNLNVLANPEALEYFKNIPELTS